MGFRILRKGNLRFELSASVRLLQHPFHYIPGQRGSIGNANFLIDRRRREHGDTHIQGSLPKKRAQIALLESRGNDASPDTGDRVGTCDRIPVLAWLSRVSGMAKKHETG